MPRTSSKTPAKRTKVEKATTSTSTTAAKSSKISRLPVRNLLIAAIIISVIVGLGFLRGHLVAANVNGEQITRLELMRELEKQEGRTVLDSLINETLIDQEANNKKINISDQELNDEIKKIEKSLSDQGQNLDDLLTARNLDREELKKQVKTQLILRKMAGKVEVTDKEVDDYLAQNKDSIPAETNIEEIKPQVKAQLEQEKLSAKIQGILSELQQKANIEYLLPL